MCLGLGDGGRNHREAPSVPRSCHMRSGFACVYGAQVHTRVQVAGTVSGDSCHVVVDVFSMKFALGLQ